MNPHVSKPELLPLIELFETLDLTNASVKFHGVPHLALLEMLADGVLESVERVGADNTPTKWYLVGRLTVSGVGVVLFTEHVG